MSLKVFAMTEMGGEGRARSFLTLEGAFAAAEETEGCFGKTKFSSLCY
jgi:hypothetical protein